MTICNITTFIAINLLLFIAVIITFISVILLSIYTLKQCWQLEASNKIDWNWKFPLERIGILEDVNLPISYVHWKLPIKIFGNWT